MAEMEWRAPRPPQAGRKPSFDMDEVKAMLMAKPGDWLIVMVKRTSNTKRLKLKFGPDFEVTAQRIDPKDTKSDYEHFVRYIGPGQPDEPELPRAPGEVRTVRGAFGCGRCKARFSTPGERDAHERGCKETRSAAKAVGR